MTIFLQKSTKRYCAARQNLDNWGVVRDKPKEQNRMNTATVHSLPTQSKRAKVVTRTKLERAPLGVVQQIRLAFHARNRLATLLGIVVFGAFAPLASFWVAHFELATASSWRFAALGSIVLGSLVLSAKTVYQWANLAFRDAWKATGYVILVEGVMIFSVTAWLAWIALGLLIIINGIAGGVNLTMKARKS